MKFKTNAPSPSPDAALPASPRCRHAAGRRCWSLGAALLLGLSGYGCGRSGSNATEATPPPTPTATPSPAGTPVVVTTPTPEPTAAAPRYSGQQQAEYVKTAQDAFIEARGAKATAFTEANNAFVEAGGVTTKGLNSKQDVEQRRAMITKCQQANDDLVQFYNTQDAAYRTELEKTPLTKADVDGLVQEFSIRAKAEEVHKLRQMVSERYKTADDMLAFLGSKFGAWSSNGGRLTFKKPSDIATYAALQKKYTALTSDMQKLQDTINTPLVTPGASPSPGSSPALMVSPGPTAAVPATSPVH